MTDQNQPPAPPSDGFKSTPFGGHGNPTNELTYSKVCKHEEDYDAVRKVARLFRLPGMLVSSDLLPAATFILFTPHLAN